jgi:hypothetical protein
MAFDALIIQVFEPREGVVFIPLAFGLAAVLYILLLYRQYDSNRLPKFLFLKNDGNRKL